MTPIITPIKFSESFALRALQQLPSMVLDEAVEAELIERLLNG